MKKLFKNIKFIHILLIILILVVFLGLFKKEIASWNYENLPAIRYKTIDVQSPCKIKVQNPKWSSEVEKKCQNSGLFTLSVFMRCEESITEPQQVEQDSTCSNIVYEKWFWAFGKYWWKM